MIDAQKEFKADLKMAQKEFKADLKMEVNKNAQLLRAEFKAEFDRARVDFIKENYSSFWKLLIGLPIVFSAVITAFGLIGGTVSISFNPEYHGPSK